MPSPTPQQQHLTQSTQQQRRRQRQQQGQRSPRQQSMSLVPLASVTTGNATDSANTTSVAAAPHFRRNSEGPPAATSSSPPSPAFTGDTTSTTVTSWYAYSSYGGAGGSFGRMMGQRDHRGGSRDPPGRGPCPMSEQAIDRHVPWPERATTKDEHRGRAENGEGVDQGALTLEWRPRSRLEEQRSSYHQYSSSSTPTRTKITQDPVYNDGTTGVVPELPLLGSVYVGRGYEPGIPSSQTASSPAWLTSGIGGQYREANLPPSTTPAQLQGGGYGRASVSPPIDARIPSSGLRDSHRPSHAAGDTAVAAVALDRHGGNPPFWDLGSARRGTVDASSGEVEDGLASRVLGGDRWSSGAVDRSGGGGLGAYMGFDVDQEPYKDGWLQPDSPVQEQHRHSPFQLHDRRHGQRFQQKLTPTLSTAGITASLPRVARGSIDPGLHTTGLRPIFSGMASSHRSQSSVPGLAQAVSTVPSRTAGGRRSSAFSELPGDSRRHDGRGVDGNATTEGDGTGQRDRLNDHKPAGSSICMEEGCDKRSRYVFKNRKEPAYCLKHRLVGMVDTRHGHCKDEQCTKQPSFGMEGDLRASYCARHKEKGMVNVSSRRCQQIGCMRSPNFGFPGDRRASYCKGHRECGMVDIVSRRCRDPSCTKRPVYSIPGMRPVFCSKHKHPGMIDVVSARCEEKGCSRHPSFGYASDMKARRCARHCLENMEGVKRRRQNSRPEEATVVASATIRASFPTPPSFASSASWSFSSGSTHEPATIASDCRSGII